MWMVGNLAAERDGVGEKGGVENRKPCRSRGARRARTSRKNAVCEGESVAERAAVKSVERTGAQARGVMAEWAGIHGRSVSPSRGGRALRNCQARRVPGCSGAMRRSRGAAKESKHREGRNQVRKGREEGRKEWRNGGRRRCGLRTEGRNHGAHSLGDSRS
jgi:hypothetical protein